MFKMNIPSPTCILPLPVGGGGLRRGFFLVTLFFGAILTPWRGRIKVGVLPKSSPSLWEGEEKGGGGHFEHLNFGHCFEFRISDFGFFPLGGGGKL